MASNFPGTFEVGLVPRRGHDMNWSCDDHGEPIKFYCVTHKVTLCHPCAFKEHQSPCVVEDLEKVVKELETTLEGKLSDIKKVQTRLIERETQIKSCKALAIGHLKSVSCEINATYNKVTEDEMEKEGRMVCVINEDAEEEIRIANKKRETRLKKCREEAEKRRTFIKGYLHRMLDDIKNITYEVGEKIDDLQKETNKMSNVLKESDNKLKLLLKNDKDLVNNGNFVVSSLDEALRKKLRQSDVEKLSQAVQRVRLVTANIEGDFFCRIDGYVENWELIDTIGIPASVEAPSLVGFTGDGNVSIADYSSNDFYVTNLSNGKTDKVVQGTDDTCIVSCTRVNSEAIACGKWKMGFAGENLAGCISLYDRHWRVIRDIAIPRNTSRDSARVVVAVDRDGMILAAELDQSNIYVVDPANGRIQNTITISGKKVHGSIQVLASGDIVMKQRGQEFVVVSREGSVKTPIRGNGWTNAECSVDQLSDTLFVTNRDKKRGVYTVDRLSRDGAVQASGVVEYAISSRSIFGGACFITPSRKLVCCNGDEIFIYKKSFAV